MSVEIEAKFAVPDVATFDRLLRLSQLSVYALEAALTVKVVDRYYDTGGRALLRGGYACRLRREGDQVMATVKGLGGATAGIHQRQEWEVIVPDEPSAPPATPPTLTRPSATLPRSGQQVNRSSVPSSPNGGRQGGGLPSDQVAPSTWPASQAREVVLLLAGDHPLDCLFELRQLRHHRLVRDGERGVGVLSLDQVTAIAGAQPLAWWELEIELGKDGRMTDLEALRELLQVTFGLRPEPESKFARALRWRDAEAGGNDANGTAGR